MANKQVKYFEIKCKKKNGLFKVEQPGFASNKLMTRFETFFEFPNIFVVNIYS